MVSATSLRGAPELLSAASVAAVLGRGASAFALLHRPGAGGRVEVLLGDPVPVARIADLPLPPAHGDGDGPDLVAALPWRQIAERGLACVDDGAPIGALAVRAHGSLPLADAVRALPDTPVTLDAGGFDRTDGQYADAVRRVIAEEIGRGTGANFVLRRSYRATVADFDALAVFRRLLTAETGAYWTFLMRWDGRTLIGASPECHVRLDGGRARMHPISGTYRYPRTGPTADGLRRFLADGKESDELAMVLDEELKIMARVCAGGGRVSGPRLRPMSRLAHTEYLIDGPARLGARGLLRETFPAPTVTGGPVRSACRVIAAHEGGGRGYYGGVLALLGRRDGRRTVDSAIMIRTAEVSADGRLEIGVGATLVRHSDPAAEAAETRAKAAALLAAFGPSAPPVTAPRMGVAALAAPALAARNDGLSGFWQGTPVTPDPALIGRRVLIADAEDDFTAMLAALTAALGPSVSVVPVTRARPDGHDLVLLGPGPGDPREAGDPRIAAMRTLAADRLAARAPTLAVCLGHQVVAGLLGLPVLPLPRPAQGQRRIVRYAGRAERVGFYNTFAARSATAVRACPLTGDRIRVLRDPATGVVHALGKPGLRAVQFHVESVLTERGPAILRRLLRGALNG